MPAFVVLLRGVNVSGKNLVKMALLRDALKKAGFVNPKTYVQSGNIVVSQAHLNADKTRSMTASALEGLGIDVPIIVRSAKQWMSLPAQNPYFEKAHDKSLYVVFLEKKLKAAAHEEGEIALSALATQGDRFHLTTQEVFLHLATSAGTTKLANTAIEKKLNAKATRRNWRTIEKIQALIDDK